MSVIYPKLSLSQYKQRGVVLIIVLWFIVMALMLVSYLAFNTRLAAKIVMQQYDNVVESANIASAVARAKYEVMKYSNLRNNPFILASKAEVNTKFTGEVVSLTYPADKDLKVRIRDHAGKININKLSRFQMEQLLKKLLGEENSQISHLLDAWEDWIDNDKMKRLNGAEDAYYSHLQPAYYAANAPLQRIDELLLIKGYKDIPQLRKYFDSFTVHGALNTVNPNYADRETLLLIPGITEKAADQVISRRAVKQFKRLTDLDEFFTLDERVKMKGWLGLLNSQIFSILVYNKQQLENEQITDENEDIDTELISQPVVDGEQVKTKEIYAYKEVITISKQQHEPLTLRVYPSAKVTIQE